MGKKGKLKKILQIKILKRAENLLNFNTLRIYTRKCVTLYHVVSLVDS